MRVIGYVMVLAASFAGASAFAGDCYGVQQAPVQYAPQYTTGGCCGVQASAVYQQAYAAPVQQVVVQRQVQYYQPAVQQVVVQRQVYQPAFVQKQVVVQRQFVQQQYGYGFQQAQFVGGGFGGRQRAFGGGGGVVRGLLGQAATFGGGFFGAQAGGPVGAGLGAIAGQAVGNIISGRR